MLKEQGVLRVVFTWAHHLGVDLHELLDAGKGLDQAQLGGLAGLVDALRSDVGTAKITVTPLICPRVAVRHAHTEPSALICAREKQGRHHSLQSPVERSKSLRFRDESAIISCRD